MPQSLDPLITDMLRWIGQDARDYDQVMARWRTSCPQLTVWEDAIDRGLVARVRGGGQARVRVTAAGTAFLARNGGAGPE